MKKRREKTKNLHHFQHFLLEILGAHGGKTKQKNVGRDEWFPKEKTQNKHTVRNKSDRGNSHIISSCRCSPIRLINHKKIIKEGVRLSFPRWPSNHKLKKNKRSKYNTSLEIVVFRTVCFLTLQDVVKGVSVGFLSRERDE